jgi:hypothetical protein
MMHKEGQTVTIRHREFISTIKSSVGFVVSDSFQLNPGNSKTFPWLSTIASSFQEYRFKGIVFHYIPTSGNAISGTSPSLGSVMMQTSYRGNDAPPSTKAELLNEYWSGEAVPSETFAHPIECDPKETPMNLQYVRTGELPATDSRLFYDLGVTHLATQGQLAADNVLGDLWVTYEVELKKPIVSSNVTSRVIYGEAWSSSPPVSFGQIFNTLGNYKGALSFTGAGNTLTFAAGTRGTYMAVFYIFGVALNLTSPTYTRVNNVQATGPGGYTTMIAPTSASNSTSMTATYFRVIDPSIPTTLQVAWAGTSTSISEIDVVITRIGE